MTIKKPQIIKRDSYKEPEFLIPEASLILELNDKQTIVTSVLEIKRNGDHDKPLRLDCCKLKLLSIGINGNALPANTFVLDEDSLVINNPGKNFTLKTVVEINPLDNLTLEGLYKSDNIFCTQNEPEGFRRITFFADRPDVLSVFTIKIIADKSQTSALLANGNCIESGDLDGGKHFAVWHDPFPKPSYLVAIVAGNLGMIRETYMTSNGREIDCRIYCDPGNEERCAYALASLMKAMAWDEKRFGLEYDLDIYMIVAVDSFNMGAMENKGLNIFNSKYVLASADTATDDDFLSIEAVVAHEYFHNWTGNRVTLRDWFQLTLKEGLTVFREQEFSSDERSRPVQRINDVNGLRSVQFVEDVGPNAHAVRPESYMEINNFYTATIYDKGAEVCRMVHTILGEENFQKGMKHYFKLFDGMAVTCEDFIRAMEISSGVDLSQFRLWYSQAGTPVIFVNTHYDEVTHKFHLKLTQQIPDTPGQTNKQPMHIPLALGLLNHNGKDIKLDEQGNTTVLLHLKDREQEFVFDNITVAPHLSINRNFSAPVAFEYDMVMEELIFRFAFDSDTFNRWDAGQSAAKEIEKRYVEAIQNEQTYIVDKHFVEGCRNLINSDMDNSFKALAILLPSEDILIQEYEVIDFDAIHTARKNFKHHLALELENDLLAIYTHMSKQKNVLSHADLVSERKFILRVLDYLVATEKTEHLELCKRMYFETTNMTIKVGVLNILSDYFKTAAAPVYADFYDRWKNDRNVIMKWFAAQSAASVPDCLNNVLLLEKNPAFDIRVPNLVRVVSGVFGQNLACFHDISGSGYSYMAERIIEIDSFNPSISSSLARSFKLYAKSDERRKSLMKHEMQRILSVKELSKNTREIVENTLNN